MEQNLFRILYCSRNLTDSTPGLQDLALGKIFQIARANNVKKRVTGALLYSSDYFAQVLEGSMTDVEQVFEKIQRDPRHSDVTVLESSGISCRNFPEWSMARVQPVTQAQAKFTGAALQHALTDPASAGPDVLVLMRNLVIQDD